MDIDAPDTDGPSLAGVDVEGPDYDGQKSKLWRQLQCSEQ